MKRIFMLCFLLYNFYNLVAASYTKISSNTVGWNVLSGYCDAAYTDSIVATLDSIKGSVLYSTVFIPKSQQIIGQMVEDTLTMIAHFIDNEKRITTIYNDTLEIGDTVSFVNFSGSTYELVVETIDDGIVKSIVFQNSIQLCTPDIDKVKMIEGIGLNIGLNYFSDNLRGTMTFNSITLCSWKDDELYSSNTIYSGLCSENFVGISEIKEYKPYQVNYALGKVSIESDGIISRFQIINSKGSVILVNKELNAYTLKSDLRQFGLGLRMVIFEIEDKIYVEKIMVY